MAIIDEEIKSRFESEQHKALLNIMFTASWLRSRHNAVLTPSGLSMQQYNILRILRGAQAPVNMQTVKERMVDRAPNATRLVDKLIEKGLVQRERATDDRRVVHLSITLTGLELLGRVDELVRGDIEATNANLSIEDATVVNRVLDRMRG
ncbi:MAG: MarR family transcriptional regulator [Flavobacteriales bacterium]|nr:MAG: MarR family transcriptional regulator [Flavobacteriales bacterium]